MMDGGWGVVGGRWYWFGMMDDGRRMTADKTGIEEVGM